MANIDEELQTKERSLELWDLGIKELAGHNIEAQGREEVNRMLAEGWILLHIYTLKYREDGTWRERRWLYWVSKLEQVCSADVLIATQYVLVSSLYSKRHTQPNR